MTLDRRSHHLVTEALDTLEDAFGTLPEFEPEVDLQALRPILLEVAARLGDNFPYPHPLYAGQMLKPPHPVARLAYTLALWINPNNHALDGGRASSAMELEAVAALARMFGWNRHLGHLTGGGTMANLEALWVSGRFHPGGAILASEQAHYTHGRISAVLQLPFEPVAADRFGRMDLNALAQRLERGGVSTVVATLGATGSGAVDPLPGILALRERHRFRIHVDTAYGGFFTLAGNLAPETRAAFDRISEVDSIVVDPHKHGLQPYGCGCVLFRDPAVGAFYKHDTPYTYFTSKDLHLGEISLECSRPGAAAVALWATQRLLPPVPGGAFARDLERGRRAALELHSRLARSEHHLAFFPPELDIVLWAPRAAAAGQISRVSRLQFEAAAARGLHLALIHLPASLARAWWPEVVFDRDDDTVTCLRSVLMKPEHEDWLDRIWEILETLPAT
jgi:glutamate/tyrosine decarboxylase-like PLP-dependent enzyme